jgi:hypothetical protein
VAAHAPRGPSASTPWKDERGSRSHPATRPEAGSTCSRMPPPCDPRAYGPAIHTPPSPCPIAILTLPRSTSGSGVVAVTAPVRWSRRRSRPVRSSPLLGSPVPDRTHTARRACLDRAARERVAEPAARPPPDPRLLAQPDRALLLDRPAQGAQPNSFDSLDELADRLLRFGEHYRQIARPFD